jgi:hypothetical protein
MQVAGAHIPQPLQLVRGRRQHVRRALTSPGHCCPSTLQCMLSRVLYHQCNHPHSRQHDSGVPTRVSKPGCLPAAGAKEARHPPPGRWAAASHAVRGEPHTRYAPHAPHTRGEGGKGGGAGPHALHQCNPLVSEERRHLFPARPATMLITRRAQPFFSCYHTSKLDKPFFPACTRVIVDAEAPAARTAMHVRVMPRTCSPRATSVCCIKRLWL